MQHIEKIAPMSRNSLKAFVFLTNVKRDDTGYIVNANRAVIYGFNQKHAISRFRDMTAGADFIVIG